MSWDVLGLQGYLSPQKILEIMRMGGFGSRTRCSAIFNLQYQTWQALVCQHNHSIPFAQSDTEREHLRIRISGNAKLEETWIRLHNSHYIYRCLSLSKEAFFWSRKWRMFVDVLWLVTSHDSLLTVWLGTTCGKFFVLFLWRLVPSSHFESFGVPAQ